MTSRAVKTSRQRDLKNKLKLVRKFADGFTASDGYDLRDVKNFNGGRIGAIEKYYKVIAAKTKSDFQVYKTRDKVKLREAQNFAQHDELLPRINAALIPKMYPGQKIKVDFDWSRPEGSRAFTVDKATGRAMYSIPLDLDELEDDPEEAVENAISQYADESLKYFLVQCGEHLYYQRGGDRVGIAKVVSELCNKYNGNVFNPNDKNSHYFGNWMTGIKGYQDKTNALALAKVKTKAADDRYKAFTKEQRKKGFVVDPVRSRYQYNLKLRDSEKYIEAQVAKYKAMEAAEAAKRKKKRAAKKRK